VVQRRAVSALLVATACALPRPSPSTPTPSESSEVSDTSSKGAPVGGPLAEQMASPDAGTLEARSGSASDEVRGPPTGDGGTAAGPVVGPGSAGVALLEVPPPSPRRLDFRAGEPTVPIRLMEGRREVTFVPRGRVRLLLPGTPEKTVEAPGRTVLRVQRVGGSGADRRFRIQVAELAYADRDGLAADRLTWEERGHTVRLQQLGQVFGIAGKIIDNRRTLILLDPLLEEPEARARQAELLRRWGARTVLAEEVRTPAQVQLRLEDGEGTVLGTSDGPIRAETPDGEGFDVRSVEHSIGYPKHGFENRSYRGGLSLTADSAGKIAVVNLVSLEDLLRGLVPSEIFSTSPAEALKAQAVTARGEVLAKVGTRHLADPYLLCSEQHCAVYKGRSGESPATNAAVEATRGEALFSTEGRLVDSVYSAVCGGHTEDNEVVWGGVPDPSLRGRPDVIDPVQGLPDPRRETARFLAFDFPAACRRGHFAQPAKYRWERRFTAQQMDALVEPLGVGAVQHLQVLERGASGRVRALLVSGVRRATEIRGELVIRRRFGMLNSALFTLAEERDGRGAPAAFVFTGGGWGHGVGLCQTGAIGRAELGQDYRAILRHYFNGAEVARIYE
jgi:stage II sporulation protein D